MCITSLYYVWSWIRCSNSFVLGRDKQRQLLRDSLHVCPLGFPLLDANSSREWSQKYLKLIKEITLYSTVFWQKNWQFITWGLMAGYGCYESTLCHIPKIGNKAAQTYVPSGSQMTLISSLACDDIITWTQWIRNLVTWDWLLRISVYNLMHVSLMAATQVQARCTSQEQWRRGCRWNCTRSSSSWPECHWKNP